MEEGSGDFVVEGSLDSLLSHPTIHENNSAIKVKAWFRFIIKCAPTKVTKVKNRVKNYNTPMEGKKPHLSDH
jgi:hypothetical protein